METLTAIFHFMIRLLFLLAVIITITEAWCRFLEGETLSKVDTIVIALSGTGIVIAMGYELLQIVNSFL